MPKVWRGVGLPELFEMRNGNQRVIEMSYIEKFWRPATAADVARVMAGEVVKARFTQNNGSTRKGFIAGWKETPAQWMDSHGLFWDYCQVYDPPQWFLDKPEPGEGFRLLRKEPDEALRPGDESLGIGQNPRWFPSEQAKIGGRQVEGIWYRRRIEQPKPEPKFAVGQRVQIIGPPTKGEGPIYNWCVEMDKYIGVVEFVRSQPQQTFEGVFYQVSNIANWSFREDYLEPVVEPEPKHYTLQVGDTADTGNGFRITITEHGVEVT